MIAALPLVGSVLSTLAPSAGAATGSAGASAAAAGPDFTQMLGQVSSDAVQRLRSAESAAVSGIEGKATTQDVVSSVMSAQESLQTALAIRDKAVAAFQEVSRMSI